MNTDMTGLHEEFGVDIPTAPEIDPNQCFNEELLKSFKDTIDQQPHLHVNTILGSYATVVPDSNNQIYPQLIWIDEIHDLESIRNTITGEVRPRGWQIRDGEDVNEDCVNDYHQDIVNKEWVPTHMCGCVFELEDGWYSVSSRGVKRKYGVANLHHRLKAAAEAGEDYIIAWVIKFKDLRLLAEWACAEANRNKYTSNPRKDNDIVRAIQEQLTWESELKIALDNAEEDGEEKTKIIVNKLKLFHLHGNTINGLVRKLESVGVFTGDRRRRSAEDIDKWFEDNLPSWKKTGQNEYLNDQGVTVKVVQNMGNNHFATAGYLADQILADIPHIIITSDSSGKEKLPTDVLQYRKGHLSDAYKHIDKMGEVRDLLRSGKARLATQYNLPGLNNEDTLIYIP